MQLFSRLCSNTPYWAQLSPFIFALFKNFLAREQFWPPIFALLCVFASREQFCPLFLRFLIVLVSKSKNTLYYCFYTFLMWHFRSKMCVEGRFSAWCDTSGIPGCSLEGRVGQVGIFLMWHFRSKNCVEGRFSAWCDTLGIPGCGLERAVGQVGGFLM